MIQTMSGPNDWLQFYHQNFPNQTLTSSDPADSTTITTTTDIAAAAAAAVAVPQEMVNLGSPTSSTQLGPEGRVSKPTRRRSRASRRTPTTLLNTDTTNFRAMVQQFTGGPTAPFPQQPSSSSTPSFSSLMGFGLGPRAVPPMNPNMVSQHPFYQQHPQQQHHMYHQQPQNQQHYNMGTTQGGGDDTFFQRLMSNPPRPQNNNNNNAVSDVHDGVLMEHGHGHHGGGYFPNTSSSS